MHINRLGAALDSKNKEVHPWDYYPVLFEKEKELYREEAQEKEMQDYKNRRREAMNRHNAARRRKEV